MEVHCRGLRYGVLRKDVEVFCFGGVGDVGCLISPISSPVLGCY